MKTFTWPNISGTVQKSNILLPFQLEINAFSANILTDQPTAQLAFTCSLLLTISLQMKPFLACLSADFMTETLLQQNN